MEATSVRQALTPAMLKLSALLVILVFGFASALSFGYRQIYTSYDEEGLAEEIEQFETLLAEQSASLSMLLDTAANDSFIRKALKNRDREALLEKNRALFEHLRDEHHITHFYFDLPDRTNLLRVHQPARRGDIIDRATAIEAQETGEESIGIELGPLGTFTLRAVQPIYDRDDGKLLGFMELGKEIEDILVRMHADPGVEIIVSILKSKLNRDGWESGMKMLGREAHWDLFKKYAIIYTSFGSPPTDLPCLVDAGCADGDFRSIRFSGKDWRVTRKSLYDKSGDHVGEIFVLMDLTETNRTLFRLISLVSLLSLIILAAVLFYVFALLRTEKQQVFEARKTLEERYIGVFEQNKALQWLIDPEDGRIIDANNAACEFYGYPHTQLCQMKVHDINIMTDKEQAFKLDNALKGVNKPFHFKHRLANGQIRDMEVHPSPVHIDGRKLIYSVMHDVSDRVALEKEMELYAAVIRQSQDIVVVKDLDLRVIATNYASAKAAGYNSPEEMIGKTDSEIFGISPDEEPVRSYMADERTAQTLPPGEIILREEPVIQADGETRYVLTRKYPIYSTNGELIGTGNISNDITERINLEKQIKESEERYRLAVEGPHSVGLYDWNVETGEIFWSGRYREILGLTGDAPRLTYDYVISIIHPDDREDFLTALNRHLKDRVPFDNENRQRHADGTYVWVHAHGQAVWNENGDPVRMAGSIEDISVRKKIEAKHNRLLRILELTPDFIGISDKDRNNLYHNPGARRILGIDKTQKTWTIGKSHPQWCFEMIRDVALPTAKREGVWQGETVMINRDGKEIPMSQLIIAHEDPETGLIYSTIARDISDQKEIQKALERAREDAESANRAKTEFLANISHEIRTPMNGILGTTILLTDTKMDDEQRKYADIIKQSGEGLLRIINDVLDISKIEAGKLKISREILAVKTLITESVDLFKGTATAKGLEMVATLSENVPEYVVGDSGRIRQVCSNLISNAVKFTKQGSVHVNVSLETEKHGEAVLLFKVIDTGPGIPKFFQDKIFDKFTQADTILGGCLTGTGLGLSISKYLVEMMGGEIGYQTSENGTEFWFLLSLPIPDDSDITRIEQPEKTAITLPKFKAHILLAEDVETNRFVITNMFKKFGITYDIAENGQIAVDLATHNDYDLIFMDLRMPVMEGFQAAGIIKQYHEENGGPPIVALTAYALEDHRRSCMDAGMEDFLSKPLRLEDLTIILEKWLAHLKEDGDQTVQVSSGSSIPILDLLVEEDPDQMVMIASAAIQDLEDRFKPMCEAAEKEDYYTTAECSHAIKSVAADLGAEEFSKLAKEIEFLCRNAPDKDKLLALIARATGYYNKLRARLEIYTADES